MLLVYSVSAKPPKVKVETEEDKQYNTYVEMYNDSTRFFMYLDSIVKSYNFCITDTNEVFNLRYDNLEANDKTASFPGGSYELLKFLSKGIQYSTLSREMNVEGKVVLKFIVIEDGSICNLTIIKRGGYGLSEEAIRVFSKSPKWIPAKKNGKAVKSYYVLPVTFKLA